MIFDTIFLCVVLGLLGYITYRALCNIEGDEEEHKECKHNCKGDCVKHLCNYISDGTRTEGK